MRVLVAWLLLLPAVAHASPNVELDDPRYDQLPAPAPLTEAHLRRFLHADPLPTATWLRLDRASLGGFFDRDRRRPYSTALHPRDLTGGIAVSCEHNLGRPCIGSGIVSEVDGSAGYGNVVSATLRLRGNAGSQGYSPDLAVDRAYALAELDHITLEAGRDVLVIGPRSRTQLGWGDNAPPLDHIRVSAAVPYVSGLWAVGRLRDPQRFPDALVSISRLQLDLPRTSLALNQQIQMGGDGAPHLGPVDFLLEHIHRRDLSASATDSSNRRFGGDITTTIHDVRLYYAAMFEDIRKTYWYDAVRFDCDHLLGVDVHTVTVEYHQTGVRSQEHNPRTTGFTNANRTVGSPLGPDARSLSATIRVNAAPATLYPWLEVASLASDTYAFENDGPIRRTATGPHERRYRVGLRSRLPMDHDLSLETDAVFEHVTGFGFTDASRENLRLGVQLVYRAP